MYVFSVTQLLKIDDVDGNKWIYRIFPIALNIKIERLEMRFRPSGTPEML